LETEWSPKSADGLCEGGKAVRVNNGDLASIDGALPECWRVDGVRSQNPHSSDEPRNKVTGGAKAGRKVDA